jgi:cytochrome c biogenesis protein CcdA
VQQWISQTLANPAVNLVVLLAALLLGLIGAVATAGCSLPILGVIVGFSGTRNSRNSRTNLISALFFTLGAIIALVILGSVAGFIGQVAQNTLGKYWKLFAGIITIFFGLAALKLLPFKLPKIKSSHDKSQPECFLGAAMFGLAVGGGVSVWSMCCNPGIFIVLGAVVLHGYTLWAMTILVAYAIGFSLPLVALMLGVSFGKMAFKAKNAEAAIRIIAGVLLIAAGFYFLKTL